jgi:hypothetical protein
MTMLTEQSYNKKRGRDSDLLQPLPTGIDDSIPASLELKEVLDPEVSQYQQRLAISFGESSRTGPYSELIIGTDTHYAHGQPSPSQNSVGIYRGRNDGI